MAGTSPLRADIVRPSKLGAAELDKWRELQRQAPALQRAFLSPTFAQACERAGGRAYVAVFHQEGCVRGFFPFQFRSAWHQRLRFAERIGGEMSDAAGIVAEPGLRLSGLMLLSLARLSSLSVTHLMPGQEQLGLDAAWSDAAYITDLRAGDEAFYQTLLERDRAFVRETERKTRRAQSLHGTLVFTRTDRPTEQMIEVLVAEKRQQYLRTHVTDVFASAPNLRLIGALREDPTPDCRLVMDEMVAGGRVLARHLGPQYQDVLSIWFPVYAVEAHNLSPGRLLLWHMVRSAKHYGIGLVDYGAGDAVYKRRLANAVMRCGRAHWSSGDIRSAAGRVYQALEWRLHTLRRRSSSQAATQS